MIAIFTLSILLLVLLNVLIGFKNKKNIFLFISLVIILWVIYWSNSTNVDYDNYLRLYNLVSYDFTFNEFSLFDEGEIGFYTLIKIFKILRLDYTSFLAISSFFFFFILFFSIQRLNINLNLAVGLYFFIPYFLDVVQVRNFFGLSLFFFSLFYLFNNKFGHSIKFIFFILIASTFHFIYLLFLPFILFKFLVRHKRFLLFSVLSLTFTIIVYLNRKEIPFLIAIASFLSDNPKFIFWLTPQTNFGFLLYWTIPLFFLFLSLYFYKVKSYKSPLIRNIFVFNLLTLIHLPFYFYASTFNRLSRNLYLLQFGLFSNDSKQFSSKFSTFIRLTFLIFFLIQGYVLFLDFYLESTIISILENNLFVEFLLNLNNK